MSWNCAMIFSYGLPIPGREKAAVDNFGKALAFFEGLATEGKCSEPEVFHRMAGGGMMVAKFASLPDVNDVLATEECRRLMMMAELTATHFDFETLLTGDRAAEGMLMYTEMASTAGF